MYNYFLLLFMHHLFQKCLQYSITTGFLIHFQVLFFCQLILYPDIDKNKNCRQGLSSVGIFKLGFVYINFICINVNSGHETSIYGEPYALYYIQAHTCIIDIQYARMQGSMIHNTNTQMIHIQVYTFASKVIKQSLRE